MAGKMSWKCLWLQNQMRISSSSVERGLCCFMRQINRRLHRSSYNFCTADTERTKSAEEVEKFGLLSSQWWEKSGDFVVLKAMNKLRVNMIKDSLLKGRKHPLVKPLNSFKILDVGSGGGLLSEPLARLGANVTGIDPSEENIIAASAHAKTDPHVCNKTNYICSTVEELVIDHKESFDAVVASEVIEHVNNQDLFVKCCSDLIKPGGHVFFTTINRTLSSLVLAKFAAEYILRIVPAGVHDWDKFITTTELTEMLRKSGMEEIKFHGMIYNPFLKQWYWCDGTDMNYACHARKPQL